MQVPLQITMRNIEHSSAIEKRIRNKANKLQVFSDKIVACTVVIEMEQAHRQQGKLYHVRINVSLPQKKELIANHNQQDNLYMAIRDAFDNITRQVEEAMRIMQGEVKTHQPIIQGEIARIFKGEGFGFIINGQGEEFYFNADNLTHGHFDKLEAGASVQFLPTIGAEGPRANRIKLKQS